MNKRIFYLFILLVCVCANGWAQHFRASGTVMCDRVPVSGASVSEIDNGERILNHTTTDAAGHFVMEITDKQNSLQISADGYRTLTQEMEGHNRFNFTLVRKLPHTDSKWDKRIYEESTNLLYGHNGTRNVPQMITVELLNDSMVTLAIPVVAKKLVDAYPEDREILFLDVVDNRLLVGLNMTESFVTVGEPDKLGHLVMTVSRPGSNYEPGNSGSSPMYTYPQFLFKMSELQKLIDKSSILSRIAVQTEEGDNYWILHPNEEFGPNLQKILKRLTKRAAKMEKQ